MSIYLTLKKIWAFISREYNLVDIIETIRQVASNQNISGDEYLSISRCLLALDAVKQINEQVAESNDFHLLMNLVLYTLSGQFSTGSAFIVAYNPEEAEGQAAYSGIGEFERSRSFEYPGISAELSILLGNNHKPFQTHDLQQIESCSKLSNTIVASNVELLAPMWNRDEIIGVVGLGCKLTNKPYSEEDIVLLSNIIDAVSPIMSIRRNEFFDMFNSSRQAVFILNSDYTLKQPNKAAIALLKHHVDPNLEIDSLRDRTLAELLPESIFLGWVDSVKNLEHGSRVGHVRNLILKVDGIERFFEAFVVRLNSQADNAYSLMLSVEDVTNKRAAAKRLYNMQKLAEKGQMVSSIAHELNNYLGLLIGRLEFATNMATAGRNDKVIYHLSAAKKAGDSMTQFVRGLVGRNQVESKRTPHNLNSVATHVSEYTKMQKRLLGIDIQLQLAEELPLISIDVDQISQLLLNILNNAADAIKEIRDTGTICIRTSSCEHCVHLEVADDGVGISPEIKNKLFNESLTTKKDGHGFGLTVCAQILKNHDAQYCITSEMGKGSVFKFSFTKNP